jgi:ADP-ribose pyrophosphatase
VGHGASGPGHPLRESSEVLLRGQIFDLVASELVLPSGVEQRLWVVEHPGAVAIAPLTEAGELLLVRQYRHGAREVLIEIPAGRLEPGETPLAAARRELKEETGYEAKRFERLLSYFPSPGFLTERMHLYRATGLRPGRAEPEADEALEVRAFSRRQLERRLRRGQLRDGKTIIAVLLELGRKTA